MIFYAQVLHEHSDHYPRPLCVEPLPRQAPCDAASANGRDNEPYRDELQNSLSGQGVDNVFVATDDLHIKEAAEAFGASVIMTSDTCKNGTERCAEALAVAELEANLIINLQGDAPLTPPWFVQELIAALNTDQSAGMATPVCKWMRDLQPFTKTD